MPDGQYPGSVGTDAYQSFRIDSGTLVRTRSPVPVIVGSGSRVQSMPLKERFIEVLLRTLPKLPAGMQEQFAALLTRQSMEIMAGTLVVWGAGQFLGYGEVVDVALVGVGYVFLGRQAFSAGADLGQAIRTTIDANSEADLDHAAESMARFVAVLGVAGLVALFFKGAKKALPKVRGAVAAALADSRFGGIAEAHLNAFQQAARETNRIIAVRFTNFKSTPWIERGFPPKSLELSKLDMKTDKVTGFVKAVTEDQISGSRDLGYYIVDENGTAIGPGGAVAKFPEQRNWPLEKGQVIHPKQLKPVVGDYDLLGVIDPATPGQNISLAASNGKVLGDWSNPMTRKVAESINSKLDQPRIMHGAHDARFTLPDKPGEGAMIFFPDGTFRRLNSASELKSFYEQIGRKPVGAPKDIEE